MRRILPVLLIVILGFGMASPATASTQGASQFIEKLAKDVLQIVRDEAMPDSEKQAQLESMFVQHVDIDWIARFVLGKYVRTATPEQLARYKQEYQNFIVKHYTSRFTEYTGETFKVIDSRAEGNGDYLLNMEIVRPRQASVMISYKVREVPGGAYKVYDIIVEGVSMITTQRSEFSSIVSRQGMDFLIQQLAKKNSQGPRAT